jgi:hypothetical protein
MSCEELNRHHAKEASAMAELNVFRDSKSWGRDLSYRIAKAELRGPLKVKVGLEGPCVAREVVMLDDDGAEVVAGEPTAGGSGAGGVGAGEGQPIEKSKSPAKSESSTDSSSEDSPSSSSGSSSTSFDESDEAALKKQQLALMAQLEMNKQAMEALEKRVREKEEGALSYMRGLESPGPNEYDPESPATYRFYEFEFEPAWKESCSMYEGIREVLDEVVGSAVEGVGGGEGLAAKSIGGPCQAISKGDSSSVAKAPCGEEASGSMGRKRRKT